MNTTAIYSADTLGAQTQNEIPRNIDRIKYEIKEMHDCISHLSEKINPVLVADEDKLAGGVPTEPACTQLGGDLSEIFSGLVCLRSRINSLYERAKL